MLISLRWLNACLDPADLTADEAERLLTQAGFPIESRTERPDGDVVLDVEVTSNRGDCLSHVGCAREVAASPAASTKRRLLEPARRPATGAVSGQAATGPGVSAMLSLVNDDPAACALFTARVIRGAKVGPSPRWLVERLEAVGQRSISNAVDITNLVTFELGNPCHVFDLKKLARDARGVPELRIRRARAGEKLTTLEGKARTLVATDLVVADAERPQSLAGVIGGADSQVDSGTTDIVLEMATWDPVTIRTAARRLGIRTDAGYRFERGVDPRTIERAAELTARLLCELTGGVQAGGAEAGGVLRAGRPECVAGGPALRVIELRPARAELLLGIPTPASLIGELLTGLGIAVQAAGDRLRCTVPAWRMDLEREVDLIEEVARVRGLDAIPSPARMAVSVRRPQASERAMRELTGALTGLGFFETVTFSFVTPAQAAMFLPVSLSAVNVDDARRGAEPTLRPSAIPSLLACRRGNASGGVTQAGGVRLFEVSSVFAQAGDGPQARSSERAQLTLLLDVPGAGAKRSIEDQQQGLRLMRGAVERAVEAVRGPDARVSIEPLSPAPAPAWRADGLGAVLVNGERLGVLGLLTGDTLAAHGLDAPVVACELLLAELIAGYPGTARVSMPPRFPAIERDLSLVVDEAVRWSAVSGLVEQLRPALMEAVEFVGTFRGKQVGEGKKSMTLRMRFRDPERTLRHEEVDGQVESVVRASREQLGAELRA